MFFRLDRNCIPDCDALFSIYRISRVNELNDAFRVGVMETQNWRAELKVVVADARPRAHSVRCFGSRLPAGLRGTFKDLSREIRFSPDLQPRCIPAFRRFFPPSPPPLSPPAIPIPPTPVSIPFGVSTPRRSRRRISLSVLSPGYFSPGVRSHCRVRIPRGPRIGPLSPELSVNAPFASSFLRLPERKRKRN